MAGMDGGELRSQSCGVLGPAEAAVVSDIGVSPDRADLERRGRSGLYLAELSQPTAPTATTRCQGRFRVRKPHPLRRGRGVCPRLCPFVLMSAVLALLESCSLAPAPRPLPSSTHFKFVLGQFDIAEAAGCIGTGPNRPQRLYNGRCEQLVAPDGLESAAGSPYSR